MAIVKPVYERKQWQKKVKQYYFERLVFYKYPLQSLKTTYLYIIKIFLAGSKTGKV